ncbi:SDR family NAD(P)-dependent oxidoreductase [Hydrocarboniphaga sp.]|uniref:SDR family NAD(P)-dependent oxidoreductase n=1 Tax=Hydrocarboniphaga sp. TaxID=2033016 RepID=UPI0026360005|nr:SDR family NAD(P)-dependent oxidoreductase [Hydrocarboniphaga sp.]
MSLSGKTIVVTGAFGSLGKAVVQAAMLAGARVAAVDQSSEPPSLGVLQGARLYPLADIGSSASATSIVDRIASDLGGIHGAASTSAAGSPLNNSPTSFCSCYPTRRRP